MAEEGTIEEMSMATEDAYDSVARAEKKVNDLPHLTSEAEGLRDNAEEIKRIAKDMENVAEKLETVENDTLGPASAELENAREILSFLRDASDEIEASGVHQGTLEIDGIEYEVSITPVGSSAFGRYIRRKIARNDGLQGSDIVEHSLVTSERLDALLGDPDAQSKGDEAASIIKALNDMGYISEEEREYAKTKFSPVHDGNESGGDTDSLADLFG